MARYIKTGSPSTIGAIDAELDKIQVAVGDTLSRKGDSPNQMEDVLDMNSNRIINLPSPQSPTDAVRLQDVTAGIVVQEVGVREDPFDPSSLQIIAHRGFRNVDVQNTMLAFSKCKRLGAKVIEADLQVTSDGVVVVFHDNTVDSLTDGTGSVASMTLAQVQALQFTELAGTEIQSTVSIPTFDDLLSLAERDGLLLSVEMKNYRTQSDIGLMIDKIAEYNYIDKTVIASFQYSDSLYARAYNSEIRVGLIGGGNNPATYEPLFDLMAADGLNFIIWSSGSFTGNSQTAEYARSVGLKIQAYTITDAATVEVCLRKGIFAIM